MIKYGSTLWQNALAVVAAAATADDDDDDDIQIQAGDRRPANESISDTRHRRSRFSHSGATQQTHDGRRLAYTVIIIMLFNSLICLQCSDADGYASSH